MPSIKVNQRFYTSNLKKNNSISLPEDIGRALSKITDELRNKANIDDVKRLIDELSNKLNGAFRAVERGAVAGNTSVINTVTNSGSSGGSSSSNIPKQVTKSVTGGTTYAEVFDAPSYLLGLPIAYTTTDGLMSWEHPPMTLLTVNGFTVIPIQDGQLLYSYINI